MASPPLPRWALLLFALACQPGPRAPTAISAYATQVESLLSHNRLLNHRFTCLAVALRQRAAEPEALAETLAGPILAEATSLASRLRTLAAPSAARDGHRRLTAAWEDRVTAYEDLHYAWREGSPAEAEQARRAIAAYRHQEELALQQLNGVIVGAGPTLSLAPVRDLPPCGPAPKKSGDSP